MIDIKEKINEGILENALRFMDILLRKEFFLIKQPFLFWKSSSRR
jgi:hypothetical protein